MGGLVTVHYPFIEAGRVQPLCGARLAHVDWTTPAGKVTCRRCRQLLRGSELAEAPPRRGAPGGDAVRALKAP